MMTLTATLLSLALAQAPAAGSNTLSAAPALAATASPPGQLERLTLVEALQRAEERNLDLQAALTKVTQAKANVWKAWSSYLPQVNAQGSYQVNDTAVALNLPVGFGVVDVGAPQPLPPGSPAGATATPYVAIPNRFVAATIQPKDQTAGILSAQQALIAPPAWFAIQSAYRAEDVVTLNVEQARRDVLFGVAQVFYGVASYKKLVDVAVELQQIAARQAKDADVRFRAGTIPKVAKLRADIDLARAEQDTIRAQNNYAAVRLTLATLLDRDDRFEVVEAPEPVLPADTSKLEQEALQNRPDVQAARAAEGLAESLRRISFMRYLPSLGAYGRATYTDPTGLTGQTKSWAAGLALSWTILDGGLREAEIRDTSAKIAEADANRRAMENRARAEVQQSLLDLESAKANARKAKEQRDLAAENQRLVDVSFKAGAATAVEQADATAQLRTAEIALATESLNAQLAAVRVLKVSGQFAGPQARAAR
jgi:outer membrane protein TolC